MIFVIKRNIIIINPTSKIPINSTIGESYNLKKLEICINEVKIEPIDVLGKDIVNNYSGKDIRFIVNFKINIKMKNF